MFNLSGMMKIIFVMLSIVAGNNLFAQYLHYADKPNTRNTKTAKRPGDSEFVYHDWPDRCPGMSGSIPVLTNYVPGEMVLKLTEIYKGHLYSISSITVAGKKLQYKLKVCVKGEIKIEYADEAGTIITK